MNERPLLKVIGEVHNCLAVWNSLSVAYKDTKNKQKKLEKLADKLGFIQTFLFLHHLLFRLDCRIPSPLFGILKCCNRSPAVNMSYITTAYKHHETCPSDCGLR